MCPLSDSRQIYKNQFDKKEKEEKKKEFREMKLDYPQIINKFNLSCGIVS